ncbi:MAG: HAD family phosphatase [Planctomycetes bacterium]|nr:HAD family phosphatase [Planctomycetota bacterium]
MVIPGIGKIPDEYSGDLLDIEKSEDGAWSAGTKGVTRILTPLDRKTEWVLFQDRTLVVVKSAMGYPASYWLPESRFEGPAKAVLMDLDGTSVNSEAFWIWVIEQVVIRLLGNTSFRLSAEDEPHVSGHSVSEHLQYCIEKYCPEKTVEEARKHYFDIVEYEMKEILAGRGRPGAFTPAPGLKEFLFTLKENNVKIGLVTSGLYEKAWPEIVSAFRTLDMGTPKDFYDAIITAGTAIKHGQPGTLGELSPKPHPWLYAETARVGLGISDKDKHRVVGMEDSGAGVVSIRLAGFAAIGVAGGNLTGSGTRPFLNGLAENLNAALPMILAS